MRNRVRRVLSFFAATIPLLGSAEEPDISLGDGPDRIGHAGGFRSGTEVVEAALGAKITEVPGKDWYVVAGDSTGRRLWLSRPALGNFTTTAVSCPQLVVLVRSADPDGENLTCRTLVAEPSVGERDLVWDRIVVDAYDSGWSCGDIQTMRSRAASRVTAEGARYDTILVRLCIRDSAGKSEQSCFATMDLRHDLAEDVRCTDGPCSRDPDAVVARRSQAGTVSGARLRGRISEQERAQAAATLRDLVARLRASLPPEDAWKVSLDEDGPAGCAQVAIFDDGQRESFTQELHDQRISFTTQVQDVVVTFHPQEGGTSMNGMKVPVILACFERTAATGP